MVHGGGRIDKEMEYIEKWKLWQTIKAYTVARLCRNKSINFSWMFVGQRFRLLLASPSGASAECSSAVVCEGGHGTYSPGNFLQKWIIVWRVSLRWQFIYLREEELDLELHYLWGTFSKLTLAPDFREPIGKDKWSVFYYCYTRSSFSFA